MILQMLQQVGEVHLLQLGRQEGVLLLQLVSCLQPLICLCAVTSHQSLLSLVSHILSYLVS